MQEMIFQASQGYPMPECLCYNTADLRMLTEFYSGRTSELTTTMQYSYQSTILSSCRPEIAKPSARSIWWRCATSRCWAGALP